MLEKILKDKKFQDMMQRNVKDCLAFLLEKEANFSIMAHLHMIKFNPPLPKHIMENFKLSIILFGLENYTLQSAFIDEKSLIFEAGFGDEDFASKLEISFGAIVQIILEQSPLLVNFSISEDSNEETKKAKSKNIFLNR